VFIEEPLSPCLVKSHGTGTMIFGKFHQNALWGKLFLKQYLSSFYLFIYLFFREREIKGEERKTEEKANNHS
jgi:hypothetical protein